MKTKYNIDGIIVSVNKDDEIIANMTKDEILVEYQSYNEITGEDMDLSEFLRIKGVGIIIKNLMKFEKEEYKNGIYIFEKEETETANSVVFISEKEACKIILGNNNECDKIKIKLLNNKLIGL